MKYTFDFQLPPIECSPNWKGHWAKKARAVKTYRTDCAWSAVNHGYGALMFESAVLSVEYRAHRGIKGRYCALDVQNAMASVKATVDALVDARILVNDSAKRVKWDEFTLRTTKPECLRYGGPGVTVTVRAA